MSISNLVWTDVGDPSARSRRSIVFVSVCVLGLALLPAVAQAGVGAGTAVTFPTTAATASA